MLVNCPRCGFQQPEDQYCANCGVDMRSFKKKEASFFSQVFSSGAFQVILLLIIAAATAVIVSRLSVPQSAVQKLSITKLSSASHVTSTQTTQVENVATETTSPPPPHQEQVQIETAPQVETAKAFTEGTTGKTTSTAPAAVTTNNRLNQKTLNEMQIKISFLEIPREVLSAWSAESQRQGLFQSFNDFSAGILPRYKSRNTQRFKELLTETKKMIPRKVEALMAGQTNTQSLEFLGLQATLEIQPQLAQEKQHETVKGQLNLTKSTKSGKDTLPTEFELQKGAAFFIDWKTLPLGFENEPALYHTPPFQVFRSEDFLRQKTVLVIVIEPLL